MLDLDPNMTFDTFVVGPANRLASAAARRVADSPGTSYNPLFLYAASGLGKSHILNAIAHRSGQVDPERTVVYQTLEGYLEELTRALEEGRQDAMRKRYQNVDILLLDDVQFLTGQNQAQEMLLRALDTLTGQGRQVVLASDRPPAEINGLDSRLLSQFSGGLIVDIGAPDYETRVAIIRRKLEERGQALHQGVAEAMSRYPFRNVRELQGALNRLLVTQDLEDTPLDPRDVPAILGKVGESSSGGSEGSPSMEVEEEPWRRRLREAAEEGEREGVDATSVRRLLEADLPPEDPERVAGEFEARVGRLREIRGELEALGNPWPEAARRVLSDPGRVEEAETLLISAEERSRGFPDIPDGPGLGRLHGSIAPLALRAADRLAVTDRPDFNPLFLVTPEPGGLVWFLEATARTFREHHPEGRVAVVSLEEFSTDFIRAISAGVAGAWRERWWTLELLLLHGVEGLAQAERAQEEFFHLFEALRRRGGRMVLVADRAPARIPGIDDRLRSRFEGGLLVELSPDDVAPPEPAAAQNSSDRPSPAGAEGSPAAPEAGSAAPESGPESGPGGAEPRPTTPEAPEPVPEAPEPTPEGSEPTPEPLEPAAEAPGPDPTSREETAGMELEGAGWDPLWPEPSEEAATTAEPAGAESPDPAGTGDEEPEPESHWIPSGERVVLRWPNLDDRIADRTGEEGS